MRGHSLWTWIFRLGTFLGIAYLLVGVIGGFWPGHWDGSSTSDQVLWLVLLLVGGALLLLGLRSFQRSPWAGVALISLGALAGALVIFWTVLAPVLAIALIVLSVLYARRGPATA